MYFIYYKIFLNRIIFYIQLFLFSSQLTDRDSESESMNAEMKRKHSKLSDDAQPKSINKQKKDGSKTKISSTNINKIKISSMGSINI